MNLDPRQILEHPFLYTTYQKLVGGYRARKLFVQNNLNIKSGDKLLDIGCGPGDILDFLPEVDYTGLDMDEKYIERAKKKYSHRGDFFCQGVDDLQLNLSNNYDKVICTGVLHHLDYNQCIKLMQYAKDALKTNGVFISFDGVFIENQNKIAKYFLKKDRGQFIRTTPEYLKLAKEIFNNVDYTIDESYFKIPYTSIIMSCSN